VNQSDEKLFTVLARAAERRVGEFNAQGLANTAWAFARGKQFDENLLAALARMAEQCAGTQGDFNVQNFGMTLWALSQHESLNDSWSLFEHAKRMWPVAKAAPS